MVKNNNTVGGNLTETAICYANDSRTNSSEKGSGINAGSFDWNEKQKGLILGGFYWGFAMTQFPAAVFSQYISPKLSLVIGILGFSFLDLLIPTLAHYSYIHVFVLRLFQGFLQGFTVPTCNALIGKWIPKYERSRCLTVFFSGNFIGMMLTQFLAGSISQPYQIGSNYYSDWPYVFYLFGTFGCSVAIIAMFIVYESPAAHPFISDSEKEFILTSLYGPHAFTAIKESAMEKIGCCKGLKITDVLLGKKEESTLDSPVRRSVPWKSLFTSVPFYAILSAHTTYNWIFYTSINYLPTYMNRVLGFDVKTVGLLTAIPFLIQWPTSLLVSWASDLVLKKERLTPSQVRKINTCFALCGGSSLFVCVALAGCNRILAVCLICAAMGFLSFASSGFAVNIIDIAPQYAGPVFGISNTLATMPGFISPFIVAAIIGQNPTLTSWLKVFGLGAGIAWLGAIVYFFCASSEQQSWAVIHDSDEHIEVSQQKAGEQVAFLPH